MELSNTRKRVLGFFFVSEREKHDVHIFMPELDAERVQNAAWNLSSRASPVLAVFFDFVSQRLPKSKLGAL